MTIKIHDRVETLPVNSLIPYARNSRTHSDEQIAQIAASIREFGFTNPVLIDEAGGIIAGHGRVMAARQLGLASVPCIRLGHLTEAQKRAYVIADNKLAINAGWDLDVLRDELLVLRDLGDVDIGVIGFDLKELEGILDASGDLGAMPEPGSQGDPVKDDKLIHCPKCGCKFEAHK